jgi:hypothetical protein
MDGTASTRTHVNCIPGIVDADLFIAGVDLQAARIVIVYVCILLRSGIGFLDGRQGTLHDGGALVDLRVCYLLFFFGSGNSPQVSLISSLSHSQSVTTPLTGIGRVLQELLT